MVEEEVAAISPPVPLESHKRKLEEVEPEPLQEPIVPADQPAALVSKEEEADGENTVPEDDEASQAKRPRLDSSETDAFVAENGHQKEEGDAAQPDYPQNGAQTLGNEEDLAVEASIAGYDKSSVEENVQKVDPQADDAHNSSPNVEQLENVDIPAADKPQPAAEMPEQGVTGQILAESGNETSRKLEIPNNMVGVLIGKAGDTIRNLQYSSGAKIQITRDAEADPGAPTRSVEIIGSVDSIEKAEKLIKEVIAEADAGGSPALVAKGFTLAAGAMEQVEMLVPNEKVGLIIGKGGETIKNLQTRSGARIQLIPQHLPDGDNSKERTVRISGDKKQIDMARELIRDVMNQNLKPSTLSSNYGQQQAYRPRGPPGAAPQWGPRGPRSSTPYDYQQNRGGPYSSQNQQYPPYGGYPSQGPPRGSFGPGWEQRPPVPSPHNRGGGYDRYGGQGGGYAANAPLSAPHAAHVPPARPSGSQAQANYGYGQPPYSQAAVPQPYAGPTGPSQQGYPGQQQYPPQPYSAPSQGAPPQPYPAGQTGNMPYQAPAQAAVPYGQTMPAQQPYPYGATPSTVTDGYSQPQPAGAAVPGYPQQVGTGSQPAAGYAQPGYSQAYGQYPQAQQGYGYQGQAVQPAYAAPQAYSGAPPSAGQTVYAQQATSQAGYGQPGTTAQVGYAQPAAAQAGYAQAGYAQPAAVQAGYAQPAAAQAGYAQPAAAAQAGYAQPAAAQAGYAQPAAAAAAQAGYAQPAAAQAGYAQQAASQAGYAQPAASQAGYTQPATSQAGYDQSAPQQSGGYPAAPTGTAAAPATAAAGDYQQQYDASQVYAASG